MINSRSSQNINSGDATRQMQLTVVRPAANQVSSQTSQKSHHRTKVFTLAKELKSGRTDEISSHQRYSDVKPHTIDGGNTVITRNSNTSQNNPDAQQKSTGALFLKAQTSSEASSRRQLRDHKTHHHNTNILTSLEHTSEGMMQSTTSLQTFIQKSDLSNKSRENDPSKNDWKRLH